MMNIKVPERRLNFLMGLIGMAIFLFLGSASAGPFTIQNIPVKNNTETEIQVNGIFGETFEASYTDAIGKPQKITFTSASPLFKPRTTIQAKKGTTVTVKNLSQPTVTPKTFVASLFQPSSNIVVSSYAINTGSTIGLGGSFFDLAGGFTTIDTTMDYDPLSPTYGIEGGFLSAFNIQATGSAGLVSFDLFGTPTYAQDLGPIWGLNIPTTGLSIAQARSFSGTLEFNSVASPFTGLFDGTLSFFNDGTQTISGTLDFTTDFGQVSGAMSATASPVLVNVPEPSSLLLFGIGVSLLSCQWRRQKPSRGHTVHHHSES